MPATMCLVLLLLLWLSCATPNQETGEEPSWQLKGTWLVVSFVHSIIFVPGMIYLPRANANLLIN